MTNPTYTREEYERDIAIRDGAPDGTIGVNNWAYKTRSGTLYLLPEGCSDCSLEYYRSLSDINLLIAQYEREQKIKAFVREAASISFEGGSMDGENIYDCLLDIGALVVEPYDPEKHGECQYGSEPGDDYYVFADWMKDKTQPPQERTDEQ
ncbi:hypothetical protein CA267_002005 [Alteromonas pelagimontana]|uniref:Uncharacterized protein n=1 Tax=Alteromonas pelagimontana TaxID=1858656 RepID=A0A6M4M950_9ALTE|nr:hypothetical protein [Alteromonas pelagimontana]QJR79657.1 hypothetical protein CA267_002005 [Alteromonas pelagimontana]